VRHHGRPQSDADRLRTDARNVEVITVLRSYNTIALTYHLVAQICVSYCTSQQATPSVNSAAPPSRSEIQRGVRFER